MRYSLVLSITKAILSLQVTNIFLFFFSFFERHLKSCYGKKKESEKFPGAISQMQAPAVT